MNTSRLLFAFTFVGASGLAGCAEKPAGRPAAVAATAPVAQATGGARSCVDLNSIREAKVVDDRTIDFVLSNRQILRNTLPNACPSLGFERAFSYSTSLSKLCSVDIITVIIQGGGPRTGASCGLGQFVPYTPVPAK